MNPWFTQTVAVLAWALAIQGRPSVLAAAKPSVVPNTERRLMLDMTVSFPCLARRAVRALIVVV
jgi:hypothetical protein